MVKKRKKTNVIKKTVKKFYAKKARKRAKKGRESKKLVKVPSYIHNFDNLVQGGFERNSTNLVVGGAGTGKTIFAMQFLIGGMKKGERCLYVTFEEKKENFYKHMLQFEWDLADYEKKGLFSFLEYAPLKVKTMLEEGGGSIENIILKAKISRVVIDSISSFALLFEKELEKKEAALALFNMINDWDCTSLLTLEEDIDNSQGLGSKSLEFEADSIIILYYPKEKHERHRSLEVLKMRGTKHSTKIHKFDIGKAGISVHGHT